MKPIPAFVRNLTTHFQTAGCQLYIVGGAVRDALLLREITEWDLTTDATPTKVELLLKSFGVSHISLVGQRFGTVIGQYKKLPIEVTTFRSENYDPDSRQPTVEFGRSLLEDLSRRDFTFNAIAYNALTEQLTDPYQGQADLGNRLIRSVGQANDRFREDPLRILRAIRLAVQLNFSISSDTLQGLQQTKERLALLSSERVAAELGKMLLAPKPSQAIRLMVETGVINYILPELLPTVDLEQDTREHKDIYAHILQVLDNTPPRLELRWCALLHDIAKPLTRQKIDGQYHFLNHENVGAKIAKQVLGRLKYSADFTAYVTKLVKLHQRLPNYNGGWNDGAIRRFVLDAGECLDDLFTFAEADTTGSNERKKEQYQATRQLLRSRIDELEKEAEISKIKSPLSGDELMTIFHRPPGRWIKPVKDQLLSLVLDGELAPEDKATAQKIAQAMLEPGRSDHAIGKPVDH